MPPLTSHPELVPAITKVAIDPFILQQLEPLGISREYCVQCLHERKRNHTTAACTRASLERKCPAPVSAPPAHAVDTRSRTSRLIVAPLNLPPSLRHD